MLLYKNHRFHCEGVSFEIPDGYCLETNYEESPEDRLRNKNYQAAKFRCAEGKVPQCLCRCAQCFYQPQGESLGSADLTKEKLYVHYL